jgi:hypothetical protein
LPFSITNPPMTDTITTTMPRMGIISTLHFDSSAEYL